MFGTLKNLPFNFNYFSEASLGQRDNERSTWFGSSNTNASSRICRPPDHSQLMLRKSLPITKPKYRSSRTLGDCVADKISASHAGYTGSFRGREVVVF